MGAMGVPEVSGAMGGRTSGWPPTLPTLAWLADGVGRTVASQRLHGQFLVVLAELGHSRCGWNG